MSETIGNVKRSKSNAENIIFFPSVSSKRSQTKPYNLHPFYIESKKKVGNMRDMSLERIK